MLSLHDSTEMYMLNILRKGKDSAHYLAAASAHYVTEDQVISGMH